MAGNSPVQLWEHLQEQQKPFGVEHYLAERKVMNKNPRKSTYSRGYETIKKKVLKYAKILKFLLQKFVLTSHRQIKRPQQSGGRRRKCASKHGVKVSSFREQKVAVKTNLQRRCREGEKQLCPVTAPPASVWKLTVKSMIKELGEMIGPAGFSMQLKNRVFFQKNSQFLSDRVTGKSIEQQCQRRKYQKLMDLQELGKENAVIGMKLYFCNKLEDWDYLQQPNRIEVEMGDILMDEMIQEVVDFYCKETQFNNGRVQMEM